MLGNLIERKTIKPIQSVFKSCSSMEVSSVHEAFVKDGHRRWPASV